MTRRFDLFERKKVISVCVGTRGRKRREEIVPVGTLNLVNSDSAHWMTRGDTLLPMTAP